MNLKYSPPTGWTFPSFEELALPEKGSIRIGPFGSALKKKEFSDSGIRVLGIDHVLPGQLKWHKPKFIPKQKYEQLTQYTVREGDVLVTNMGTVGRTCVVPKGFPTAIISSHLIKSSLDPKSVYPKYIARALNHSNLVIAQIKAKCHGAIMAGFNSSLLKSLKIPLPPLSEQKRIAAILDKADGIRRKRKAALDMADEFLQSSYLHLCGLGHPDYKKWPKIEIQELAAKPKNSMRTGPFGSSLKHSEFVDKGIAVLGIDNAVTNRFQWKQLRYITEEKYANMKRYTVYPNDVIITIMGTTGRSAVVPANISTAISTKHLATITVDSKKAHPEYLSNAIHRDSYLLQQVRGANRGAVMPGLNLGIIRETKLHLPPLEQQQAFATILKKTRQIIDRVAPEHSNTLFASLSQRAFRGEL